MSNILFSLELLASVLCLAYLAKLVFSKAALHSIGARPLYIAGSPFEVTSSGKRSLRRQRIQATRN